MCWIFPLHVLPLAHNIIKSTEDMEQLAVTVIKFSFAPSLIVAAYALVVFKKLPHELRVFSWFIFLSAVIELVSRVLWLYSKNNLPLLHFYVAGGFVCLSIFYAEILRGFVEKYLMRGILIVFLSFTLVNSVFIQPLLTFNSYALTVESVIIVILSIFTYLVMMEDIVRKRRPGLEKCLNWINSGLFIYFASNLIIFFSADFFIQKFSKSFNLQTWMLHAFFLLIMYVCFFMGLWSRPKPGAP